MSYHATGNDERNRVASGQGVNNAGGGNILQLAVVVAFLVLLICYVLGVSGNTALLVFIGVIFGIVALCNLLLAGGTGPAPSQEATRPAATDRSIQVQHAPHETPLDLSATDSVIIEICIKKRVRATDTTSAA